MSGLVHFRRARSRCVEGSSLSGRLRLLRNGSDLENYAVEIEPTGGTLLVFRRSDKSWHGHHPYEG
jgi:hypothetical protein